MVRAEVDLQALIDELFAPLADALSADDVSMRPSKNGNYIAVTITINATSKAQLDRIYQAMTDHEHVLMSL